MARFYDGKTWTDVLPEKPIPVEAPKKRKMSLFRRRSVLSSSDKDKTPVAPVVDGNGTILVTIPSFRDGQQCGEALVDLFEKAQNPDKIVVSLVEQQHEDDTYCVEAYCKAVAGVEVIRREELRPGSIKVVSDEKQKKECPRVDQIRVVRVQDNFAKGPPWARALGRRSLGNEEYCLQTSTNSIFAKDWDGLAKRDWLLANNEFAVLSNPPKSKDASDLESVPRTCNVEFLEDERLPHYDPHPEGLVEHLEKPLLAHAWAPGFSFAKCHLEEAAPADGFLPYVSSDIEAFARYVRMWTRGYDVYTPTQNIVYHQFGKANPHKMEWIQNWNGRKSLVQAQSLRRIRSYLQIPTRGDDEATAEKLDNLGIYGIGKRRTLKELKEFVGIDLAAEKSRSLDAPCGNFEWVPYDSEISPIENMYSDPDDLDPQPEFPSRTNLTFAGDYLAPMMDLEEELPQSSSTGKGPSTVALTPLDSRRVPYGTMFVLWVLGLALWCHIHVLSTTNATGRKVKRKKNR